MKKFLIAMLAFISATDAMAVTRPRSVGSAGLVAVDPNYVPPKPVDKVSPGLPVAQSDISAPRPSAELKKKQNTTNSPLTSQKNEPKDQKQVEVENSVKDARQKVLYSSVMSEVTNRKIDQLEKKQQQKVQALEDIQNNKVTPNVFAIIKNDLINSQKNNRQQIIKPNGVDTSMTGGGRTTYDYTRDGIPTRGAIEVVKKDVKKSSDEIEDLKAQSVKNASNIQSAKTKFKEAITAGAKAIYGPAKTK
jgi:hypothetical protein